MLLKNIIKVKSHSVKYYTDLGYPPHKRLDTIEISPNDLPKSSHHKVWVKCDVCGNIKEIPWNKYLKNISKYNIYTCSNKCAVMKNKKTNLEKYGKEYGILTESIREKIKKTNLEKYGEEFFINSDEFKEKSRDTKIIKYDNPNYNNHEKISMTKKDKYGDSNYNNRYQFRTTSLNNHGYIHPMKSNIIKEKVKITNLERYGTYTTLKDINIIEQIKKTNTEKYGYSSHLKSNEIRDKIKKTNIEKYGSESFLSSNEYKNRVFDKIDSRLKEFECKLIDNSNIKKMKVKHLECGSIFEINYKTLYQRMSYISNSETNDLSLCVECTPLKSVSFLEKEIKTFIEDNYHGEIIENYRDKYEIDIYIPSLNVGFEFNGLYWHSELYKDKNYHLDKTNYFSSRNIRIIHIWEDDWNYKKDIVKSMILNIIGSIKNRIYARKTTIMELTDTKLIRKFLDDNHIQGFSNSKYKIGLLYEGELVSLMTFGYRHTNSRKEFELIRFCNKKEHVVVGGASKLFNYFNSKYKIENIISYSDISYATGRMYEILGFKEDGRSVPNYYWVVNGIKVHRFNFTKSKLVKEGYDSKMTEVQIMHKLGHYRVFGCGQIKYTFK